MRNLLASLMFGFLAFVSQGQQVQLDPTGANEAILSNAFAVVSSNSYVTAGDLTSPDGEFGFVTMFSKSDVLWSKKFQVGTSIASMIIAENGDIIVAGVSSELAETDILVARFNISGDTLWTANVGTSAQLELSRCLVEDQDGSIIVGGLFGPTNNRQQAVVRLTASGEVIQSGEQLWMPYAHRLDEVFVRDDKIVVFGVERSAAFSYSGNISLRMLDSSFGEVYHRNYGNPFTSDGVPSVVMMSTGALIATSNSNGVGLIRLDQDFNLASSSSLLYQEALGAVLQNPRLVQDEFGYLYLGGGANLGPSTYAFVSKIDPVNMNVLWTRTLNQGGFVCSDMDFDGQAIVVPSANGSSVTMSFVDRETGQVIGTPCDMFLPSFVIEPSSYPDLAETSYSADTWNSYPALQGRGASDTQFLIEVSDCEPILLPVELTYFTAQVVSNEVSLSWSTATEHNNSHFIVERSRDTENWEDVAFVPGVGNSQNATSYVAQDKEPYFGTSYYRLAQFDLDGSRSYSTIVSVSVESSGFVLSPNPITSGQVLKGVGRNEFQVLDLDGRLVYRGLGESSLSLPSGTYIVRLVGIEDRVARLHVTN